MRGAVVALVVAKGGGGGVSLPSGGAVVARTVDRTEPDVGMPPAATVVVTSIIGSGGAGIRFGGIGVGGGFGAGVTGVGAPGTQFCTRQLFAQGPKAGHLLQQLVSITSPSAPNKSLERAKIRNQTKDNCLPALRARQPVDVAVKAIVVQEQAIQFGEWQ